MGDHLVLTKTRNSRGGDCGGEVLYNGKSLSRAGSVTEEVVLCFRVGGWWPVVTGVLQEMHRNSLNYYLLVPQLMGILL